MPTSQTGFPDQTAGGGGSSTIEIQDDETVIFAAADTLNFKGGVDVTNVAGVPTITVSGGGGGISEAPNNGTAYARRNLGWVPAASGGGAGTPWAVPWRGATVNLTVQDIDLSGGIVVSWDTQTNDTDDFWDNAAPTIFTIPAGVTKVRMIARLALGVGELNSDAFLLSFRLNGTRAFTGNGNAAGTAGYSNQLPAVVSGVIDVVAGDELALYAQAANLSSQSFTEFSYMQIEVIEATDVSVKALDLPFFVQGLVADGVVLYQSVFTQTTYLQDTSPTQGFANTAATAEAVFNITKNGSNVGTVTFAAAGTIATTLVSTTVTFLQGDRIALVAPATADATLADVSFTLGLSLTN